MIIQLFSMCLTLGFLIYFTIQLRVIKNKSTIRYVWYSIFLSILLFLTEIQVLLLKYF